MDYEQLGVFYLGKKYDLAKGECSPELVLYESQDLLTHAVVVGMTGSGKTGLCIDLLEEAAIDGIPVIAIDPKGDLSNLLLTFPNLSADEFKNWVDADEARRKQISVDQLAQNEAEKWTKGLSDWHQEKTRIQKLKDSAEFSIYTPASNSGIPVSIISSFACPSEEILEDREMLREQVSSTTTSILALLNIETDPLKSREHILISAILDHTWKQGQDLDLQLLISKIQDPPLRQLGAIPLESFFSSKDRYELAMQVNNLLAAPGFEAWMEGEALDIDKFFYSVQGKNRVTVLSISHLSDSERMFFVSLFLTKLISWMRKQSGTSSLRAIFYMDELFGYLPPVANPPSKGPLLTLLKQARAFGLGLVLATQNPVDLDYKALGNTGTWFIGRLQTERDKLRVLDGLEGAASSVGSAFNRSEMDELISGLSRQVFLINNVHEGAPYLIKTRHSLSYLRGPLSRAQLKLLKKGLARSTGADATAGEKAAVLYARNDSADVDTALGGTTTHGHASSDGEGAAAAISRQEKDSPVSSDGSINPTERHVAGSSTLINKRNESVNDSSLDSQATSTANLRSGSKRSEGSHKRSTEGNDERSSERRDERRDEQGDEQSSERINEHSDERNNERRDEQSDESMQTARKSNLNRRPLLPPEISQVFAPIGKPVLESTTLVYKPMLFASLQLRFVESKASLNYLENCSLMTLIKSENPPIRFEKSFATKFGADALKAQPDEHIEFSTLPPEATVMANYKQWSADLIAWLIANRHLEIYKCPITGNLSHPNESEKDFRIRLAQQSREKRDEQLAKLSKKYSSKLESLHDKFELAEMNVDTQVAQQRALEMEAVTSVGASIFDVFVGRRANIRRAESAVRKAGQVSRKRAQVNQAEATRDMLGEQVAALQSEFEAEMKQLKDKLDPESQTLVKIPVSLKKSNINILRLCLCWAPCFRQADGRITSAW